MAGPFGFTSYVLENDEKMTQALARAMRQTKDLSVPFAMIAKDFQKSRKAIFALKSAGLYPDLSTKPFTAWWETGDMKRRFEGGYKEYKKAKYGFDYPILKATGRLEQSVTEGSHPDNITRIYPLMMMMGTKVPYASYHQSDLARNKIPLRKFLFIGPESSRYNDDMVKGFPERALNTLNSFILRQLQLSIKQATGSEPKVKE